MTPFQPVRREHLGGAEFTENDWSRCYGYLRGSYLTLQSKYNEMAKLSPGLNTLESTTKGRLVLCRLCAYSHERFHTHMLYPALEGFGWVPGWLACFTGYGTHVVMQLKPEHEQHLGDMLKHFRQLLQLNHEYRTIPITETLVNRFSINVVGSVFGFSTTTTTDGACMTVGSILSMLLALLPENFHRLIEDWAGKVRDRRNSYKTFINQYGLNGQNPQMTRVARKQRKALLKSQLVAHKAVLKTYKQWLVDCEELAERCSC